MKKTTLLLAMAALCLTTALKADETYSESNFISKRCHHHCVKPYGSFYADSTSQPLQTIISATGSPITAPIHFSGTNINSDVTLSLSGNNVIIPHDGVYKIQWNASLSLVTATEATYHFDLQKNGTTLLNPIAQIYGHIISGVETQSFESGSASVIVPLLRNDTISLLLTLDDLEGTAPLGVEINSAQISVEWINPNCNRVL